MMANAYKRMYATGFKCPDCGNYLKRTRLNKRLFCRVCYEYKDEPRTMK